MNLCGISEKSRKDAWLSQMIHTSVLPCGIQLYTYISMCTYMNLTYIPYIVCVCVCMYISFMGQLCLLHLGLSWICGVEMSKTRIEG